MKNVEKKNWKSHRNFPAISTKVVNINARFIVF